MKPRNELKTISFAKLRRPVAMPHMLDIQTHFFAKLLQKETPPEERKNFGLQQVFNEVFPITDYQDNFTLEFVKYSLGEPKYTVEECQERDMTHAIPLKATLRLIAKETVGNKKKIKDIIEKEVFLGELPLLTELGTFVINGAERVIVSQLHRSPGVIFEENIHTNGQRLFSSRIIPFRGSWVEFNVDIHDCLYVHIDKKKKFPATTLLRVLGYPEDHQIIEMFYKKGKAELKKIAGKSRRKREASTPYLLAKELVDKESGEVVAELGQELTSSLARSLQQKGFDKIDIYEPATKGLENKLIKNTLLKDNCHNEEEALTRIYQALRNGDPPNMEIARDFIDKLFFNPKRYDLGLVGRFKINQRLNLKISEDVTTLTQEDFIAVISYLVALSEGQGEIDDIDHLGNRRIRSVCELVANQISLGLNRMARLIKERMSLQSNEGLKIDGLVNSRTISAVINAFFGSSQLSQFMDQTNPLAELTHKRRLSALGPGGLTRERAGFEVRDVHFSHYGRMCPIETPEGPNIGLITSLTTYAQINELGFIETPYRKVTNGKVTEKVVYMDAFEEGKYVIAQANAATDKDGKLVNDLILCRKRNDYLRVPPREINFIDVAPAQLVSVAAALIPFLEHDDANRALMGSNMQRQAVPLLNPEAPVVRTGLEERVARDSGTVITARRGGVVEYVDAGQIVVLVNEKERTETGLFNAMPERDTYRMSKFQRTNQDTAINRRPLVDLGQKIKKDDIIADGASSDRGQLALGVNMLCAFMPWYGYNYEDAIAISEKLIKDDKFTSIHIQELDIQVRDTKRGTEEITAEIPNVGEDAVRNLDERGIVRIGAKVGPGDILVGKVSPKGETELSPEERLLKAIFGDKAGDVKDTSLKIPPGIEGVVIDVKVFSRLIDDPLITDDHSAQLEQERHREREKIKAIREFTCEQLAKLLRNRKVVCLFNKDTEKQQFKKGTKLTAAMIKDIDWNKIEIGTITVEKNEVTEQIKSLVSETEARIETARKYAKSQEEKIKAPDELAPGVVQLVKVYVAEKRKVAVGDKMAGRHGNKGIVAKIVPEEDMPFLPDGTPVEIVLNPLGVPSRMNVGQILETHLGYAARLLGMDVETPVFHGASEEEIFELMEKANLPAKGKIELRDGRSGRKFDSPVTVGYIYMLKLSHLVEDKIHARSIGPYSLVTQQPLAGKAQFGGQRFGEMEVWALEAHGASHTLQEMLTVKSDDVVGRSKVYEAIVKGDNLPEPGTPESFNVLIKELQSLGLSVVLGKDDD
ncbi:MAG: DNA-directed RNA polymerase subunit beta [Candidatus Glassbacteria bacterium]|nr:DNA-directed RNA polymerase subunit beta [Candidatus Glassbacteria bacterium]